jgi:glycosyltransferase involved in cell wall biosynthesis
MKPLVSIISPCYNGEEYVGRMLDSILAQTYTNIEMICVDDGSIDKTADIILSYSPKFEGKNMTLKLMRQDNQGQASAVNNALKIVNGDYLCWIDCDDFLMSDSVKLRLDALEQNPEYGVCSSDFYIVEENDINKILRLNSDTNGHHNYQHNQFLLAIAGLSSPIPVPHIVRMSYFDKINPKREIHCSRQGQNYQLLLPMYYNYPRYYIDKPLGYYVYRNESHAHIVRTAEEKRIRYSELSVMLKETLTSMNLSKREIDRLLKLSYFSTDLKHLQTS